MPNFDPLSWTGGYRAVGPTLEAFFLSPAMARATVGPAAGGRKTVAAHYIRRLAGAIAEKGEQRHWRWLVVAPRHGDKTAIATWRQWTSDTSGSIAQWSKTGTPTCTVEYKNMPGRPIIEMVFLDWTNPAQRDRLGAGDCSGVWLDQARDLPEAALDAALMAVSQYYPGPLQRRGRPRPTVLVTSQMPMAEHWLPRRFRPNSDMPLFRQPGGRTEAAEDRHLRATRPDFYRELARSMPAEWVRVHVDAEWGGQSGTPEEIAQQEALRQAARERLYAYYPDEGPLRRELYPKHIEHFAASKLHQETAFIGGNRAGKSFCNSYLTTCHLTGWYPEWWPGRRFTRPVVSWAAGEDAKAVRESLQPLLLGPPDALGTGLIPGDKLVNKSSARGISDAVDFAEIRHASGGISRLLFKAYEQGRKSFQAAHVDDGLCDEEPPFDVYTEFLTRTMSTNPDEPSGSIHCGFTPLKGISQTVLHYLPGGVMPATDELRKIAWGW